MNIGSCFLSQGKLSFPASSNIRVPREVRIGCVSRHVKAVMRKKSGTSNNNPNKAQNAKAIVIVKRSGGGGLLTNLVRDGVEGIEELVGKTLILELVSNELDSSKFCFYLYTVATA